MHSFALACTRLAAAVCALTVVAGCAGAVPDPPSLMPRTVERRSLEEPAPVATARLPVSAAVSARVDALVTQARVAAATSLRATPGARSAATRGSDAWIEAEMAVSAAQVALTPARGALADAERLIADAAGRDTSQLIQSRDAIAQLVARQQARLDAVTPR